VTKTWLQQPPAQLLHRREREGVQGLREPRSYAVGEWKSGAAFEGFCAPPKLATNTSKIGGSPLLGKR
jgi:serine/threonine-protein kinase HipA